MLKKLENCVPSVAGIFFDADFIYCDSFSFFDRPLEGNGSEVESTPAFGWLPFYFYSPMFSFLAVRLRLSRSHH